MNFIDENIEAYAENHTSNESDLLARLNRETHLKVMIPRMLSGHLQGRLLSMLSHMIKPNRILEIGTYTGYSALCMAEGLTINGQIDTIDLNEELKPIQLKYFNESKYGKAINSLFGNALEIIPKLNYNYDLVFIDADKENYLNYYHQIIDKVTIGGYIIADNVLWSGNVLKNKEDMSESTVSIVNFNDYIKNDKRIENVLIPIRDGLMVLRKIKN